MPVLDLDQVCVGVGTGLSAIQGLQKHDLKTNLHNIALTENLHPYCKITHRIQAKPQP